MLGGRASRENGDLVENTKIKENIYIHTIFSFFNGVIFHFVNIMHITYINLFPINISLMNPKYILNLPLNIFKIYFNNIEKFLNISF